MKLRTIIIFTRVRCQICVQFLPWSRLVPGVMDRITRDVSNDLHYAQSEHFVPARDGHKNEFAYLLHVNNNPLKFEQDKCGQHASKL